MLKNKQLTVAIARRVFPTMGTFSTDQVAKIGAWDAHLCVASSTTWLTVYLGRDKLFQIETRGDCVKATYALPTVVKLASGEKEYGTAWVNSHRWRVDGWDILPVVAGIRKFFDNYEEFCEEEAKVYRILEES